MAEGFLGRWSQRKQDVRSGKPLAEPEVAAVNTATSSNTVALEVKTQVNPAETQTESGPTEKLEAPLPTLEDVKNLTPDSDYAPFVARHVSPEVRNTAMKKLFADPHYNVMDRLDIYIDDYSKPDPIPESMLRQMVSAKFLNLFTDDEEAKKIPTQRHEDQSGSIGDDAHNASMQSMAQSAVEVADPNTPSSPGTNDDHSDLRLQQNHAAEPHKSGRGTE
ncbi:MAG: DUF3306 domain-containing protein [Burkholderiaceae bacterium]